jgi:diguanylate cyclase (GGDEF)-like protein
MVALDGSWPRNIGVMRSVTIEIVVAIFASALASAMIALFVSVARSTPAASELWRDGLSVAAIPPTLIGLFIAFRMRKSCEQLSMTHEVLLSLAWIDALTGLLNRQGFDAAAAVAFDEARRLGQPVSALMCDIDAFRGLNDKQGHLAGDSALRNLTQVLEEALGHRAAILARPGGDEFLILLPNIDLKAAVTIAEDVCEACEARALVQQDPAAKFTISIGVGTEASRASELGGLLRQTDAALYRAKRAGGNQVASGLGAICSSTVSAGHQRVSMRSATH